MKRNVMNDKFYHNIVIVIWIWSCFILIKSYEGNLTAMITRPKLNFDFTKLEDFVDQDEMLLVVEVGTEVSKYMKQYPANSTMRRIIDKTFPLGVTGDEWPSMCFTKSTQFTKKHASICDNLSISLLLSDDFIENGICNWYTLNKDYFERAASMAFQVITH